jgi:hypothetical protein
MNNNLPALFRSLIVYAVCIPLAMWVGYLLTQLDDRSTYETGGILLLILCAPILLRWHHLLLIASWNFSLMIFFLPGSPFIWLPMTCLSLGISVLQRTLNSQARFISAPQITWPLICLLVVVLFTAQLTGGIGLRSLGSEVMGGKRYVLLLMGILGYFAISAKRIPPQRAGFYLALFFLGSFTNAIGDLAGMVPRALYPIFAFFPVSGYNLENDSGAIEHQQTLALVDLLRLFHFNILWRFSVFNHPVRHDVFFPIFHGTRASDAGVSCVHLPGNHRHHIANSIRRQASLHHSTVAGIFAFEY